MDFNAMAPAVSPRSASNFRSSASSSKKLDVQSSGAMSFNCLLSVPRDALLSAGAAAANVASSKGWHTFSVWVVAGSTRTRTRLVTRQRLRLRAGS